MNSGPVQQLVLAKELTRCRLVARDVMLHIARIGSILSIKWHGIYIAHVIIYHVCLYEGLKNKNVTAK